MIKTVLFDLDGTLLPMDQEKFVNAYIGSMTAKMKSHGYIPEKLATAIWKGTGAMVQNDGSRRNEDVFWQTFGDSYGKDCRCDESLFFEFYLHEFQQVAASCGQEPLAANLIGLLKEKGIRLVLATNPLFPAIATHSRVRWSGLNVDDFEYITTYENSSFCKPNLDYYREILGKLKLKAEECLMVGNDVAEDMIASQLGMQVFLLTDCLINKHSLDISPFPHGSFPELIQFVWSL